MLFVAEEVRLGVGSSCSAAGGEGTCEEDSVRCAASGSAAFLWKKLGIGKAEGAGDAWKVAPANAIVVFAVEADEGRCGVGCPPIKLGSDATVMFLGVLPLFFDRDLLFPCWDELFRAGDIVPRLPGVCGATDCNESSKTSVSEA